MVEPITIRNNEQYLRKVSADFNMHDPNLKSIIGVMKKYCLDSGALAISGVQLGIPKRIIYLRNTDLDSVNRIQNGCATPKDEKHDEEKVIINPIILERYGLTKYWESCVSTIDLCSNVERPYLMLVNYIDEYKDVKEEWFEGFEATVLSHEIDHLDGVLHMDKALDVVSIPANNRRHLRQAEGFKIVRKEDEYEDLITKEEQKILMRKKY